jgi:TctA family transporter
MMNQHLYYFLMTGAALGFVLGLIPGIGGKNAIILTTPLALLIGGMEGVVFLIALHSVIHTSSSIPAIAYGVPVTSSDMATVQDGYPLARQGKAAFALGASLSSSVIGGVIGAIFFLVMAPILKPFILKFGPPEFLVFAIFGLTVVSSLSESGLIRGWIVCFIGMIFAMIGVSPVTSEPRFTFGSYDLWAGVNIQIIVASIFVIPEMLSFFYERERTNTTSRYDIRLRDVLAGLLAINEYKKLVAVSSWYGIMIGMLPGVGSSISCWMSYAYAKKNVVSDVPYGDGAVAGVIGPEAANNAKEGGALLPTLLIGIPGSSVMAILMASFTSLGLPIGTDFFKNGYDLVVEIAMTILLSNIFAFPLFLALIPLITKFSISETKWISLIAAVISFNIALSGSFSVSEIILFIILVCLGFILKVNNWARAPLLLGFVLWPLIEKSTNQISQLWGWSVFSRPIFVTMFFGLLLTILIQLPRQAVYSNKVSDQFPVFFMVILIPVSFFTYTIFFEKFDFFSMKIEMVIFLLMVTLTFFLIALLYPKGAVYFKYNAKTTYRHMTMLSIAAASIVYYLGGALFGTFILISTSIFSGKSHKKLKYIGMALSITVSAYILSLCYAPRRELIGFAMWRLLGY